MLCSYLTLLSLSSGGYPGSKTAELLLQKVRDIVQVAQETPPALLTHVLEYVPVSCSGVQSAIIARGTPADIQLAADSPEYAKWREEIDRNSTKAAVWTSTLAAEGAYVAPSMPHSVYLLPNYADVEAMEAAVNKLYTLLRIDVGVWVNLGEINTGKNTSPQEAFTSRVMDLVKKTASYESRVHKSEPVRKEYKSVKSILMVCVLLFCFTLPFDSADVLERGSGVCEWKQQQQHEKPF